jgi:GT2 family glycosyltransferase
MPDDAPQLHAKRGQASRKANEPLPPEPLLSESDFDEAMYLRAYIDVAEAVARGDLKSGEEHYRLAGKIEGRLLRQEYRDQVSLHATRARLAPAGPLTSIDRLAISESGALLLIGWSDDHLRNLTEITVHAGERRRLWRKFPRLRRADVESAVGHSAPYHYGFWVFAGPADSCMKSRSVAAGKGRIEFEFSDGSMLRQEHDAPVISDREMRDLAMGYFANAAYHGNALIRAFAALDADAGATLVDYNRMVSADIASRAIVQRFGYNKTRFKASLIIPLYGMHHYHSLQSASYAGGAGIEDCEFIYVLNSPELVEPLCRDMRIAEMIYGHAQTLVMLPGNAGFGAANNVAVQFARSDRLICVNPDVFPKNPDWARLHADIVEALPEEQTRLFGTTLYYDDGSLMHGGMYVDLDRHVAGDGNSLVHATALRVEHYGKGAPEWAAGFKASRPVTAVTGAFVSVDRAWFEAIGRFSETYIYGHYEDADLCLKSLKHGAPAWLHDIAMWHLEGKGSIRLPHHQGGSLVNRWLFTRSWEDFLVPDLIGKSPKGLPIAPASIRRSRSRSAGT